MTKVKNIFNIPSHYHFFESLFAFLSQHFAKTSDNLTIFLPNHRSCRELQQLFLEKNPAQSVILPNIKAISDISYEDFFAFLPHQDVKEIINELVDANLISGTDYLFFLSNKVRQLALFGDDIEANQAINIASQLENLFDEIERDDVDLDVLNDIDDSDLSLHRQITLDFLKHFHVQIKNTLIKENIYFSSSYQNLLVNKFVQCLETYGSDSPLIIAGSTGSIAAGKKLIKAISKQDNGYVILHGAGKDSYQQEYHPQFLLSELVRFLEITYDDIKDLTYEESLLSGEDRMKFMQSVMLPNEESLKWQNIDSIIDCKKTKADIEKNIKIIETKDEIEEAKIIALMIDQAVCEHKKCAIITNNETLGHFLRHELTKRSLDFNDSRNVGLHGSRLVHFILLLLELIENDFSSYELLAMLRHPLFKDYHSPLIKDFELTILRHERKSTGLSGIKDKLKLTQNIELNQFFNRFYDHISPLIRCKNKLDIASYLKVLINVIENLTNQTWQALLEQEAAQIELFAFFESVKLQHDFLIDSQQPFLTFQSLFSKINYFEKSNSLSPIQILSSIEARLINRDLVIISSLNEGDFPEIESDNWLGRKIKKDLGVDKKLKKIGQNAYDFCNYLCNSSLVLTRPMTRNGSAAVMSPFLLKLKTLSTKIGAKIDSGDHYFALLKRLEYVEPKTNQRPNPKPAFDLRPNKLAITDISKLRQDPYSIYAKRILKLRELQVIDFEPSYAEFGSFVHEALEEFVKAPKNPEIFLKEAHTLFEKYFISDQAKLLWWPKFETMFLGFLDQEAVVKASAHYCEIPVEMVVNEVLIRGKIDRINIDDDGNIAIFDYKTGFIPSNKDVISGKEPQLTIAALMLIDGMIDQSLKDVDRGDVSSIHYWKLSSNAKNEVKAICKKQEDLNLMITAARSGIEKLLRYFADDENGYISAPDLKGYRENEYSHLARVKQWG